MPNAPTPPPEKPVYPYGYGLDAPTLADLYLRRVGFQKGRAILSFALLAHWVFLLGYSWVKTEIFQQTAKLPLDYFCLAPTFFMGGCLGFFITYRHFELRAAPKRWTFAVMVGFLGWGFASWTIFFGVLKIWGW